jgi:hypothetical protein
MIAKIGVFLITQTKFGYIGFIWNGAIIKKLEVLP